MTAPVVLEEEILSSLSKLDASGEFLKETIERYRLTVESSRRSIEKALDLNDLTRCREIIHKLEGASGMIGANEMSAACRALRDRLEDANTEIFSLFDASAERTIAALSSYQS